MNNNNNTTNILVLLLIVIIFISTICILHNIEIIDNKISEQQNIINSIDYSIKLNSDNTIYLITVDTIRKIDINDLEEIILKDNL